MVMTTDKSQLFFHYWHVTGHEIEPLAEFRFLTDRKFRFDWAFPEQHVAVEVEGNAWKIPGGGKHMQDKDLEKYNLAVVNGWKVLRFSPAMLNRDPVGCCELVDRALNG